MALLFVEHGTCELINELPGPPPAVGETVTIPDMETLEFANFAVVEVHGREVRVEREATENRT